MKMNEMMGRVGTAFSRAGFGLKKHSPEILMVAGIVGAVASAVMACRATTKLSGILDGTKKELDTIHAYEENPEKAAEYSAEDARKDTAIVYLHTGLKLAKLYAPAVGLGALSAVSILASNDILRKRNAALAAAYVAVDRHFKGYRDRVVERFGEEVDRQLRYNIKAEEIEETVTDDNGDEKRIKNTVEVADPNVSGYVKYFTRSNPFWENDQDYVEMFLRAQQSYANDKLRAVGHLTLNDVYEMLGFRDTKAGMVVG